MRQILYTSRAISASCEADLDGILQCSVRNNPELGISGVLLLTGLAPDLRYVQIIEGEREVLAPLMEMIATDRRHRGIEILLDRAVEAPSFRNWSMGYLRLPLAPEAADAIPEEIARSLCRDGGLSARAILSAMETSVALG